MSEHAPDRQWFGIDIVKLVAGTLAAVSAAVIGSFLGVAGTLGGAAVASIVGGIGTELYAKSLKHGVSKLRAQPVQPPVTAPAAMGTPAVATSSAHDETPGHFDPVPQAGADRTGRSKWRMIAIPAVAFFVLAMGAVSVVEGFAGESLAGMFGDKSAGTSTFGTAVKEVSNSKEDPAEQDKTPATDPSGTPTDKSGKPAENVTPAPGATTTAPADGGTTPTGTTAPEPTAETGTDPGNTGDGTGTGEGKTDSGDAVEQGGTGGQEGLTGQQAPDRTPRQVPERGPAEAPPAE